MKASNTIKNYLKNVEGFRSNRQWDKDHWVIGYGHTATAADLRTVTKLQADQLFDQDIRKFENYVNAWSRSTGIILNQNQFDALVSFTYNLGSISKNLTAAIKAGNAYSYIQRFIYDNGEIQPGLITRRKFEADLFITPDYKKLIPLLGMLLYL